MMRKKKLEMHTCRKLKNDFSLLLLFPPNLLSRRNIFDFQINARGPPVLYIIHGASQVIVCHHSSPFQSFFRSPFYRRSSSIYFSNIFWQSKYMDEETKSWIKTKAFKEISKLIKLSSLQRGSMMNHCWSSGVKHVLNLNRNIL